MIKNLIMDDASWLKLDIMSLFSRKTSGIYSINTLCSEMQLSYTTASTLVQEIDRELFDLFGGHFLRKDGKISWQPKRYRHNQYIQYLIRESIPYNFILYSLIEPELSFGEFCSRFYLSQSTILRKLRPLKEHLQKFAIKMTASKMSLTGPEKSVRLFYITYLWAGSHGTDILKAAFDFSDEHLLMKEMGFDQAEFMNPKELFLRLAVNRLRYEQGCYLSDPPFETVSFGDMLGSIRNYCDGFIKEPEQAHLQARFFCFMMYFSPFYLHMDDFRIKMLEDYFEELQEDESPIAKLLIEFESFFFNELVTAETVDYEESFLLHINTFLTLMNYLVYEDKIPLIMDITEYPTSYERAAFSELQQQILAFFKKISRRKDYQWLARCVEPFAADITDAVLPTYKACFNQQYLNVAIVTVPDYFILQTIRDLLHQFTFVNVTYTNQNDPNVDFYITTFQKLLPEGVDKPYFVVPLIKDYDCQTELFELLWAAYKEKMINKITFEALERDLDQNLETIQEVINEDFEE